MRRQSTVLIIDDEDGRTTKRLLGDNVASIVRHPNEVTESDLRRAGLVLVDYKLDDWPERNAQKTPSLQPRDGIALIAVLRSNLAKASPVAFALNSGMLRDLNAGRPTEGREHAIARAIDLEWVFSKGSSRDHFPVAVEQLANAVKSLPTRWPDSSRTRDKLNALLAIPKRVKWNQSAIEAIDRSYPPHDIMIGNGSGVAVLRWLLHLILPYPTFLLDERYLAARLRIEPASFSRLMRSQAGNDIRRTLRQCEYKGLLSGFAGVRWWRPGIEQWIWDKTKGKAFDREAVQKLVVDHLAKGAEFSDLSNPVVAVDTNLQPSNELTELADSVEIKPDGWPSFADCAWIAAQDASDPAFVGLVPQSEKNKL